jgi:hypothetical protein
MTDQGKWVDDGLTPKGVPIMKWVPDQVDALDDQIEVLTRWMSHMREEVSVDGGETWWDKEQFAKLSAREVAIRVDELNLVLGIEPDDEEETLSIPHWAVCQLENRIKELEKQREA